nr:PHP domain-containing protein [uncultured Solibaculum sp.]
MRVYYDLHIHSALSPCGDDDMTPNNIVNMAKLSGLTMIAVTDHNSCLNCPAAVNVGRQIGVTVVPGMELCTAEDIHVVCLFPDLESSVAFSDYVHQRIPPLPADDGVFGRQLIMDEEDNIIGSEPLLLVTAAELGVDQVHDLVASLGGACFPAHIDKSAYSILASLGAIPPEAGFTAAEISIKGDVEALREKHPILQSMPLLLNSDAHMLDQLRDAGPWLELPECTPKALIDGINRLFPMEWAR